MRRRFPSSDGLLSVLFAGWLFGLVLETAPHRVHHLFDQDQGSACEFFAVADAPAVAAAPVEMLTRVPVRDLPIDCDVPHCPAVSITAAEARAPPLSCLAFG
jgi:hypothetical protein